MPAIISLPCDAEPAVVLMGGLMVLLTKTKRSYVRATVNGGRKERLTAAEFRACDWGRVSKPIRFSTQLDQRGHTEHIIIIRLIKGGEEQQEGRSFLSDRLPAVKAIKLHMDRPLTACVQVNRLLQVATPRLKWFAVYYRTLCATRRLALAMGMHCRLGVDSVARCLDAELLCLVCQFF